MTSVKNNKINVVIMEPVAYIRNSMQIFLEENCYLSFESGLCSFESLDEYLSINKFIDVIFCEMYDHSNNVIEGILNIRSLVKKYPYIRFCLYTNIKYAALQKQCYITDIFQKKKPTESCHLALKEIAQSNGKIVNFPDLNTVQNELSVSELKALISFSHYHDVTNVSINTGLNYKYISSLKRNIMRKLQIKNNSEFNLMLSEIDKVAYNFLYLRDLL